MRLFKISLKNVKHNIKNYTMYILSMVVCIAIFYNFMCAGSSDDIEIMKDFTSMRALIGMCVFILILFFISFMNYSTEFFVSRRKKEFGIYTFMGVENKKIAYLFAQEGLIIGIISVISGIILGIVTNRMFMMGMAKVVGENTSIDFEISYTSIIYTFIIFAFILMYSFIREYIRIIRMETSELLKSGRSDMKDYKIKSSWLRFSIGILGLVMFISGGYIALNYLDYNLNMSHVIIISPLLIIIGINLMCRGFITEVVLRISKNKKILYKGTNIINFSSMSFNFIKNNKVLAITSVLIVCCITAFTSGLSTKMMFKDLMISKFPYSVAASVQDKNQEMTVKKAFDSERGRELFNTDFDYIKAELYMNSNFGEYKEKDPIISYSDYERIRNIQLDPLKKNMKIEKPDDNEIVCLIPSNIMGVSFGKEANMNGKIYNICEQKTGYIFSEDIEGNTDMAFVVSDNTYKTIRSSSNKEDIYKYMVISLKNYRETENISKTLDNTGIEFSDAHNFIQRDYQMFNLIYFISVFMSIVFVIAIGSMLYFRYITSAIDEKMKFDIMRKIGVDSKFINKSVIYQAILFFFIPYVIGISGGIFGGIFAKNALNVMGISPILEAIVIFTLIYIVYIFITARKYLREIR